MNLQENTWFIEPVPLNIYKEIRIKNTISDDAPVSVDRLRIVHVSYYNLESEVKKGQIMVLDAVAPDVLSIFKELFTIKFPIAEISLIIQYNGDDDASMAANNTSSHNFRKVAGSNRLSLHSYGTAIDINPLFNPYIIFDASNGTATYLPPKSIMYANRNIKRPNKPISIGFAEEVVDIFANHGFYNWGGYWDSPIDYQHFQLDRQISYILASCNESEGIELISLLKKYWVTYHKYPEDLLRNMTTDQDLFNQYKRDPSSFLVWVKSNLF